MLGKFSTFTAQPALLEEALSDEDEITLTDLLDQAQSVMEEGSPIRGAGEEGVRASRAGAAAQKATLKYQPS